MAAVIAIPASAVLVPVGVVAALEKWPAADPEGTERRVRWFGASFVYMSLCAGPDFRGWDTLVRGVGSGDPRWLNVAVHLAPVRDGHCAEELEDAVSAAFEANPSAAVEILVPAFTAESVCGAAWTEEPVDLARAKVRLAALAAVRGPAVSVEACRAVLKKIADPGQSGARSPEARLSTRSAP